MPERRIAVLDQRLAALAAKLAELEELRARVLEAERKLIVLIPYSGRPSTRPRAYSAGWRKERHVL